MRVGFSPSDHEHSERLPARCQMSPVASSRACASTHNGRATPNRTQVTQPTTMPMRYGIQAVPPRHSSVALPSGEVQRSQLGLSLALQPSVSFAPIATTPTLTVIRTRTGVHTVPTSREYPSAKTLAERSPTECRRRSQPPEPAHACPDARWGRLNFLLSPRRKLFVGGVVVGEVISE